MTYLGAKETDISTHFQYGKYTSADWAMFWIHRYSGIDGSHHKDWLIDQVARILKGGVITAAIASWDDHPDEYQFSVSESQQYKDWVQSIRGEFIDGEYEYGYNVGIAP